VDEWYHPEFWLAGFSGKGPLQLLRVLVVMLCTLTRETEVAYTVAFDIRGSFHWSQRERQQSGFALAAKTVAGIREPRGGFSIASIRAIELLLEMAIQVGDLFDIRYWYRDAIRARPTNVLHQRIPRWPPSAPNSGDVSRQLC
jgi:hypothetical protein